MKTFIIILFLAVFTGNIEAKSRTYTGTVVPILKCDYIAGIDQRYMEEINKVPRIGQTVHPPVFNEDGKIITPGTILVQSKLMSHIAGMLAEKNMAKSLKFELNDAAVSKIRIKKLYDDKVADGLQKLINAELLKDKLDEKYDIAEAQFMQGKDVLKALTDTAQFTAVVDEVYQPIGAFVQGHKVVEISQLNPIAVNVKMDRASAVNISTSTLVKIYPTGHDTPVGVFHGYGRSSKDGYLFAVYNSPKYNGTININGSEIPVIENVNTVLLFYFLNNTKKLGVPIKSIFKDDIGYYVWKGLGTKNMQPGQGLKKVFPVKKVYIKPGDLKRNQAGYTTYQILNDPGKLELYDIILLNPPEGLKDNSLVCYLKNDYIFMPGDEVKVVIGE